MKGAQSAPSAGTSTLDVDVPISVVAERTGLSRATLRAWQHRYGLGPSRTSPGGHRRYSPADIERLERVRDLVADGVPAGEAARVLLAATVDDLRLPADIDPAAHRIAGAALDLDGPTTRRLLTTYLTEHGVLSTWEKVLRPLLAAIGARWAELPHGVAVEHVLSHVATVALGELAPVTSGGGSAVLLACAPDELHDLPLIALAATLSTNGVPVTLLGARTPPSTLFAAVARHQPAAVVVLALTNDKADLALLKELPPAVVVAAGPGWDPGTIPATPHINDLDGATKRLVDLHARRR